jgi:outer membrane protein assembly factor BamB
MKFTHTSRKQTASFSIAGSMLAIAPLWLILAAANTSAQAQTTESSADWTQFLRDNMQRWNPYETVLNVNNVGSLQLKWSVPIGNYTYFHNSSPAVANGVVYIGSDDHNLYALNAATGAKLWSYPTGSGSGVGSSPAVVNGVVYIASGGYPGNLYALNASTGAQLWSYAIEFGTVSSPAVANGVVYFGSPAYVFTGGAINYGLYALNASTGALRWSFGTGGPMDSSPPW